MLKPGDPAPSFALPSTAGKRVFSSALAKAYGAYGEKSLYGKKTMGTIRSTYLVDEKGKIAGLWTKVKVDGHVDEVVAHVRGGSAAPTKRPAKKK